MKNIKLLSILAALACMVYNAQAQCAVSTSYPCQYPDSGYQDLTYIVGWTLLGPVTITESKPWSKSQGNNVLICDDVSDGLMDCSYGGEAECGYSYTHFVQVLVFPPVTELQQVTEDQNSSMSWFYASLDFHGKQLG